MRHLLACCAVAAWSVELAAQPPALAPTTNVSISTDNGVLHYASIHVPLGVVVRFVGTQPALVRCDGDAWIEGELTVSGSTGGVMAPPPGESNLGAGSWSTWCTSLIGGGGSGLGGNATHRGVYGSDMPFSLLGGSPGGGVNLFGTGGFGSPPCSTAQGFVPPNRGGGTLVLRAGGRVDVLGSVLADGAASSFGFPPSAGSGSGGSILLAGMTGLRVWSTGRVRAEQIFSTNGNTHGYVRLDAALGPPVLEGQPTAVAPRQIELPHVRTTGMPRIGTTWSLVTHSEAGQWVLLYLGTPIPPTPTPFGTLGIDPTLLVEIGLAVPLAPFEDPRTTNGLAVPASPQLVGSPVHVQAAGLFSSGMLRLSNVVVGTIQN